MGLFSSKKNLCPICGGATPRILPTKIEGQAICSDCMAKVCLPNGYLNGMSLDAFREYMTFYEQNESLRQQFTETYSYTFGFFAGSIQMDMANRLLRLQNSPSALVVEGTAIKEFQILEDSKPLFVGRADALHCINSDVPERANNMEPMIAQFMMQKRDYERREQMERMRNDGENKTNFALRPTFEAKVFQKFYVEIMLEHPYWNSLRWEMDAPSFSRDYPSINTYLNDYQQKVEELHILAANLMQLLNPNAGEVRESTLTMAMAGVQAVYAATASAAAPAVDAVEEIKKYKDLLAAGIITEEEFSAKKRQLLGI